MMRTIVVWLGAVMMVGGLLSASAISQGLADEPAAPSRSTEGTGGAVGTETAGSETVPPVGEGEPALPAEAGEVQERTVSLTEAVHFTDAKGQDVVVGPGTYRVQAEGTNRIRLVPTETGGAFVIDAVSFTHQQTIESPDLVTVSDPEQPDVLHLTLLSPGGMGLDAIGTYSGVKPRALMDQMVFMTAVNMQFVAQAASAVTIYEHPNFGGRSQTLDVGGHILSDFNEIASSIQVPTGLVAFLYEHVDAGGGYGLSIDLLEDHPDLSQVNFNDKLSYVCVFSSPNSQGYIWGRASVQNGQFVAGHWERQRVGGTPVHTTAVVAPPIPPHPPGAPPASCGGGPVVRDHRKPPEPYTPGPNVRDHRTPPSTAPGSSSSPIQVFDTRSIISSLVVQSPSDAATWDSADNNLMRVMGSDYRGVQEIGSAEVERDSTGASGFFIPDSFNMWYPQKQPNDTRPIKYFKRTVSGIGRHAEIQNFGDPYQDHDNTIWVKPSAPYQYLITQAHPPKFGALEKVKFVVADQGSPIDPNRCPSRWSELEVEIEVRPSTRDQLKSLMHTRNGKPIAAFGVWAYDRVHCHQPEIHTAEQIWWSASSGSERNFNLNLFCDSSRRFMWRHHLDNGTKLKAWAAPPITGTFAIAFEVKIGNPTRLFDVIGLDDVNVAFVPNSNRPYHLVYQDRNLVSFVPQYEGFKVSYERVGLKPGTTDIVRGFLVLEATVGSVTQIRTQVQALVPKGSLPSTINFPLGTDPNKINPLYEPQVFKRTSGHYMFRIREHDAPLAQNNQPGFVAPRRHTRVLKR